MKIFMFEFIIFNYYDSFNYKLRFNYIYIKWIVYKCMDWILIL